MNKRCSTMKIMLIVLPFLLTGCVSPYYCSKEKYAAEKVKYNYFKCGGAVTADVVLGSLAVLGVVAAAQGGGANNSTPSYNGNCACPADLDSLGNKCGARSAYSRAGGASPSCIGRL